MVLAHRCEWDMDAIWQDLLGWLDKQPRPVRQRPQLPDTIQMLIQEVWLILRTLANPWRVVGWRGLYGVNAVVALPSG